MQEDDFGGWVRAVNYEVLQADRDQQYDMKVKAREQRDEVTTKLSALYAECEQLREDAEFGRTVLAKRETGKAYGCHCDPEEGLEPDECVIDLGERHNCIYAGHITVKEECEYWRLIVTDTTPRKGNVQQWQPIGTCPRHVDVLFYREDAGVFSGKLTDADSFMTDKERDEWVGTEEEMFDLDAWSYEPEGVYRMDGDLVPTHWMPLPAPPATQGAQP